MAEEQQSGKMGFFTLDNKILFAAILIALLCLDIYMRIGLIGYQGLFEPDGFFDYSVLQQAVAHGFIVSDYSNLSGFPIHNFIGEPQGEYYITLIPFAILQFFGVSLLNLMRFMPVIMGLIECLLVYVLVQYISKSRSLGLLSILFLALSSGNVARTAAMVYRGDTFIPVFLLGALVLLLMGLKSDDTGTTWWKSRKFMYFIASNVVLALGTAVWSGASFTIVIYFTALLLLLIYGFLIVDKKLLKDLLIASLGSIVTLILAQLLIITDLARHTVFTGADFLGLYMPMVLGSVAAYYIIENREKLKFANDPTVRIALVFFAIIAVVMIGGTLFSSYIAKISNVGQGTTGIGQSTQELQAPTYNFLFASFGYELFLAPIGLILFFLLADRMGHANRHKFGSIFINANYGFIVAFSYLLITAYLQAGAIRYNSLLSIPMAIFAAYAIYIVGKTLHEAKYHLVGKVNLVYIFLILLAVLIYFHLQIALTQSFNSAQADGINTQFLNATLWMKSNIPANATVLTLWPDGSVVEGWGNRNSYMDSVGGETGSRIFNFTNFLFNSTSATQYLYNNHKPQYLLVRQYWFDELGGIAEEGAIGNITNFGYTQLSSLNIQKQPNSTILYDFYGSYHVQMFVKLINNTPSFFAYLGSVGSNQGVLLRHIILLNLVNGTYTEINNTQPGAANLTLIVNYQGQTITGASVAGQTLPQTNIFKFLVLCSLNYCPYSNSTANATMKVVYQNPDTKIMKITYTH